MTLIDEHTEPAGDQPSVTIGPILAPAPPRARTRGERGGSAQELEQRTVRLAAMAVAAPALALPLPWLLVCVVLRFVAGTRRRMREDGDLASAPAAALTTLTASARAAGAALLPPRIIATALWIAAAVVAGAAVGGALPGLAWLLGHGGTGALAAFRDGAYGHVAGVVAFLAAWRLMRGGRRTAEDPVPAGLLADRLGRASDGAVAAAAVGFSIVIAACAFVLVPRPYWPASSFADAASVLPGAAQDAVLNAQSSAVDAEASAVVSCFTAQDRDVGWLALPATRRADGSLAVSIRRDGSAPRPSASEIGALLLALHNQLPGSVSRIAIRRGRHTHSIAVDRTLLSTSGPTAGTGPIARAAGVAPSVLPDSAPVDGLGLRCGAAAI
jgi:hypothetical protein